MEVFILILTGVSSCQTRVRVGPFSQRAWSVVVLQGLSLQGCRVGSGAGYTGELLVPGPARDECLS